MDGTRPGIATNFRIDKFIVEEQRIIRRLSQDWYLTNDGSDISFGPTSKYRYFLLKPSDKLKEILNFDREIIALFSAYSRFEPRTLDAFEAASQAFAPYRIERTCQLLISKDLNIQQRTSEILRSDPEAPVVIPFTYEELSPAASQSLTEQRIRDSFYTRDLFSFQSPLRKDTYFFGRSELIHDLVGRHKSKENSGLFGLRKSGKTSIIYGVERALASQRDPFLSFDCQNPAIHQSRWYEVLQMMTTHLRDKYDAQVKLRHDSKYGERTAAASFERDMKLLFSSLSKKPTLFIFDEIEHISPSTGSSDHWRTGNDFVYFWQTLRSVFQSERSLFSYLIVGTNPVAVEMARVNDLDNPLFSSIPLSYVPGFTVEQIKEMVSRLGGFMGLSFDDGLFSRLRDHYGGHPFLIRQFCSKIHSRVTRPRPFRVDVSVYDAAKTSFEVDGASYIEAIIGVLRDSYPDEYDMARFLAMGDIQSFKELAEGMASLTSHLVGYGLIQRGAEGYFFKIDAVKNYLEARHKYEQLLETNESRLAEISERRNALEAKLRLIVKRVLIQKVGRAKASAVIVNACPEGRRDALSRLNLEELLNPKTCPLFFLELINLISREWPDFQNVFEGSDKQRTIIMLQDINSQRADAHSKEISSDAFQQLRLHFSKLELMLADW